MSTYAKETTVSVARSKEEIERILNRFGADQFAYTQAENRARIEFIANNRRVRFDMKLPDKSDKRFHYTEARHSKRSPEQALESWEQDCRAHWRALTILVKAKLAAVESGITSFEEEFLAHIVVPGGMTMGEAYIPQIANAYAGGKMVALLPAHKDVE